MNDDGRGDWQRRYDESVEREQQRWDEVPTSEVVAPIATGCLPGWLGFVGLFAAAAWIIVRRRRRKRA